MNEVESIRKRVLFQYVIGIVLIAAIIYFSFVNSNGNFWIFAGGIGVSVLIYGYISSAVNAYKSQFTYNILNPILSEYGLKYYHDRGFSEDEALKSGLFDFDYDDFYSSDLIIGDDLKMSYVKFISLETYKDDRGDIHEKEVEEFGGFLIVIKNETSVMTDVFIKPNSFHLSDLLPIFYDKTRIKMDNPEFEKIFDVYGNDQIKARYVLNHTVMEKLINLHKTAGIDKIRFVNDTVYSTLKHESIYSSMPLFRSVTQKSVDKVLLPVRYALYVRDVLKSKNKKDESD